MSREGYVISEKRELDKQYTERKVVFAFKGPGMPICENELALYTSDNVAADVCRLLSAAYEAGYADAQKDIRKAIGT
jgi:hypothetical protein